MEATVRRATRNTSSCVNHALAFRLNHAKGTSTATSGCRSIKFATICQYTKPTTSLGRHVHLPFLRQVSLSPLQEMDIKRIFNQANKLNVHWHSSVAEMRCRKRRKASSASSKSTTDDNVLYCELSLLQH